MILSFGHPCMPGRNTLKFTPKQFMAKESGAVPGATEARFAQTHWSLILPAANQQSPGADLALARALWNSTKAPSSKPRRPRTIVWGWPHPPPSIRCWQSLVFNVKIATMKREIEILLLKLADGARVLRFSETGSGLCLEKRLDPSQSVARQKERWKEVFAAMLERELGATS